MVSSSSYNVSNLVYLLVLSTRPSRTGKGIEFAQLPVSVRNWSVCVCVCVCVGVGGNLDQRAPSVALPHCVCVETTHTHTPDASAETSCLPNANRGEVPSLLRVN